MQSACGTFGLPHSCPGMAEPDTSPIVKAAEEKLGVDSWDRSAIFTESASAATDNGLPYWMVLVLSGGIATLGLALNSSAVVIGAMLVAPLLAPVIGLALSLAVGDGKLAVQAGAVVLGSTLAVVLVGAVLTMLLPFHTITLEISARTRPTTLDLVIAIFSGLVGAVVTVARGSRLSAAIPGVAISVALIPPLAVAGFGVGVGWNTRLIKGSLLLYGANLAGIVLSGMAVFLLVGMYQSEVLDTARRWHREEKTAGLAGWAGGARWTRSIGVFRSAWARVGLVLAFAIALGFPLSETLAQIARETRVQRAVGETAESLFGVEDRAFILSRQVVYGSERTQVYLRVATTKWFGAEAREEFERRASALAGEPVRLSLEQIPARGEDLDQLAALLPGQAPQPVQPPPPPAPSSLGELLAAARDRLQRATAVLALPGDTEIIGVQIATTATGGATLQVAYAAPEPLPAPAQEMVRAQLVRALDLPEMDLQMSYVSTAPRTLAGTPADTVVLRNVAGHLGLQERLVAELFVPGGQEDEQDAAVRWLIGRGIAPERILVRPAPGPGLRVRTRVAPAPSAPSQSSPRPGGT